jgi:hypothetical protein
MWSAVAFIESNPREHNRQLDAAFENYDGDAMCAALYTLAQSRPLLAQYLPNFVTQAATGDTRVLPFVGRPMKDIRAEAYRQRLEAWPKDRTDPCPKY